MQVACITFIMISLASSGPVIRTKPNVMNYDRMFAMQANYALPPAILNNELDLLSSSNFIEDEPVKTVCILPKPKKKLPLYFFRTYSVVVVIDSLLIYIYYIYL